ncbi:MAG: D-alanyl-D-alanine carboxypeptidase family protein [Hyphomicrobiaceae bacterium]
MSLEVLSRPARTRLGALFIRSLLCTWVLAASCVASAAAAPRYAAMAVDANTGRVLHAEAADEPRYPASLTKVMTLYLVFEQLRQGRLRVDTPIRISQVAASVPPSKLGLEAGSTISVSDAIKALVTKSANDVAVAFAEHIAGSEERFAEAMTRKARELGMNATTFRNAHGLPDRDQRTTARDMLTLALRLYDTFPAEARVFSLRSFRYAGRNHRNHNTMLLNFAGMDGIKTGYTTASGYNLLASVHRDGRHVIAVVFGGSSASARNARMRVVLSRGLHQASTERTRHRLVIASHPISRASPRERDGGAQRREPSAPAPRLLEPVTVAAPPPAQPHSRSTNLAAAEWRSEIRLAAPVAPGTSVASRLGNGGDWRPTIEPDQGAVRAPSTLQAQAAYLAARSPFDERAPHAVRSAPAGHAEIQIGAFTGAAEARERLEAARRMSPGLLDGAHTATPTVRVGGRTLYRARFVGLDAGTASSACTELRRRRIDCLVARPE